MNDKQFIETYCHNCGTQRCEGINTEWFEGCKYRWNHDKYNAAAEIERLNNKIMNLAREKAEKSEIMRQKFINIDVEEKINQIFDIMTELHARETSGNYIQRNLRYKDWRELCDDAIELLKEIR